LFAEALAELLDALLARPAARDDREQVGPVHLREPHVVEDQLEDVLALLAPLDDLERRDDQALLEDRPRAGRQRARQRAAAVHLVAELARPADQLVLEED